jgi:hypothetical protein
MSLVSSRSIIGGVKEYMYRGFQELPIVLASTSLLYTISTGSIAHVNIALGMGVLMPLYTILMQTIIGTVSPYAFPDSIFWKRVGGDNCRIIPELNDSSRTQKYYVPDDNNKYDGSVPSYWLMSVAYFIGFSISNAVDCLQKPMTAGSNSINFEKRKTHALTVVILTCIFSFMVLITRFYIMSGCDGMIEGNIGARIPLFIGGVVIYGITTAFDITMNTDETTSRFDNANYESFFLKAAIPVIFILSTYLFFGAGIFLSVVCGTGAALIGFVIYNVSKICGARSSDLFGILSQILPASSTMNSPVVCTRDEE